MIQELELNDIEKQAQINNLKLIRQIRYERTANNCLQAINDFKEVFYECYTESTLTKNLFEYAYRYMEALAKLKPKVSKKHEQ